MPESTGLQPAITRPFRGQRRYRDPFHRPRLRRTPLPAQRTLYWRHFSAAPGAVRSRRGHVAVR